MLMPLSNQQFWYLKNMAHLTYNLEGVLMHRVDLPPPCLSLGLLPLLLDLILGQRHFLNKIHCRKWNLKESESKRKVKREIIFSFSLFFWISSSVSEKRPVLVFIAFFILLYLLKENSNVIKWTHFPSWPWRIKAYYTFGLGWKYPPV